MKLTKTQIDIIDHRLDVPDAMWDACEEDVTSHGFSVKVFDDAVDNVRKIVRTDFELCELTTVEYIVLEDAVLGSTYVDSAESDIGFDITRQKFTAISNAYDALLERLEMRPY